MFCVAMCHGGIVDTASDLEVVDSNQVVTAILHGLIEVHGTCPRLPFWVATCTSELMKLDCSVIM